MISFCQRQKMQAASFLAFLCLLFIIFVACSGCSHVDRDAHTWRLTKANELLTRQLSASRLKNLTPPVEELPEDSEEVKAARIIATEIQTSREGVAKYFGAGGLGGALLGAGGFWGFLRVQKARAKE